MQEQSGYIVYRLVKGIKIIWVDWGKHDLVLSEEELFCFTM